MPRVQTPPFLVLPVKKATAKPVLSQVGVRMEAKREAMGIRPAEAGRRVAALGGCKQRSANWHDWIHRDDFGSMETRTILAIARVLQTTVEYLVLGEDSRAPHEPDPEMVQIVEKLRAKEHVGDEDASTLMSVRVVGRRPTLPLASLWHAALTSGVAPKL